MMRVLVTGGAGFIGSHTCVELLQRNFSVCVLDNLCNSNIKSLEIVQEIGNKELTFIEGDIRDSNILDKAFTTFNPQMVIHFAGLKAVGESVEQPSKYYSNNFHGTLNLVEAMTRHNTKKLVFSSSCTVYGPPEFVPITEQAHLHPSSPYGRSKHMAEIMLNDLTASDPDWGVISLRYFNPVGAHPSGLIGEDPKGIPNNLFPYITQVALRKLDHLKIFGNDYDTKDGTGVRDYIHVVDLAKGHICALDFLNNNSGYTSINLGTGRGYSVLDVIKCFESSNHVTIPHQFVDRRPGDIDKTFADCEQAYKLLGWKSQHDIEAMCKDSWNWQCKNPNGFGS